MAEERRKYDNEIIVALARLEMKVDGQNTRLDKINGTVADYNANKFKIEEAHLKVQSIEAVTVKAAQVVAEKLLLEKEIAHEREHQVICDEIDKKYVNKETISAVVKTIGAVGTILGLLVTASTLLNIFGVQIGV